MKKQLLAIAFVVCAFPTWAQQNLQSPESSGLLMMETNQNSVLPNDYWKSHIPNAIQTIDGEDWIGVTLLVDEQFSTAELTNIGAVAGVEIGDIVTLTIPVKNLSQLRTITGVKYIEVDVPAKARLDDALPACNVPQVHAGTNLNNKYSGKGVVVGVLDYGYDFTHPTFWDTSGSDLRITRAWIMSDFDGNPPAGQIAGTEIFDEDTLLDYGGTDIGSHGTHVAGIAAGSGFPDEEYKGVAFESEIVLVELNTAGASEIINGLNYIFSYAASQGKPAVINMSLGSHKGPHDGTSLLDQAIDQMVGPGKVVVGASGNEGDVGLHISHDFNQDTIYTWPSLSSELYGEATVDIWGAANDSFEVEILVLDTASGSVTGNTGWVNVIDTTYDGMIESNGDTIAFQMAMVRKNAINNKPSARIVIGGNSESYYLALGVTAKSGKVDMWNDGDGLGAPFYDFVPYISGTPDMEAGDTLSTMGELGGTAKNIITVGAYTTKDQGINIYGDTFQLNEEDGELALFSSLGPTADGRVKPDISAPGHTVVSAVNSYDQNYWPGGQYDAHLIDSIEDGQDKWFYGRMSGTSMATPMVTGIIALWLQADENLDPDQIKALLNSHSKSDQYTGNIPSGGNNFWGRGKIDALSVMMQIESYFGIESNSLEDENWNIFPNPSQGEVTVQLKEGNIHQLQVTDMTGRVLMEMDRNLGNSSTLDLSTWKDGFYLINVRDESDNSYAARLIIRR